jgi:diguanylate cyclase (GGDEF)-like protein
MLTASGTDTAALIRTAPDGSDEVQGRGALADTIARLRPHELRSLCNVADQVTSCYTGLETTGRSYVGSEMLRLGGARSIVILPLRVGDRQLGTLVLASSRPMRLAASLIEPLELLARHVAAALDVAELLERFRRHAEQDGLTQLANRAAFDAALADEAGKDFAARRAIVITDVDRFKRVNDEYGHLGGDQALRALASRWKGEFPEASFYRFGGDEIIALVPAFDGHGAAQFGTRICETGRDALAAWDASVSVGIGIPEAGESSVATLARADAALLRAKRTARGSFLVDAADRREPATL